MTLAWAPLWDIAHLLASETSPDRILESIANAFRDLVPFDAIGIYRADVVARQLQPVYVQDEYEEEVFAHGAVGFDVGVLGRATRSGVPQLVNDAHIDPRAAHIPDTPLEPESMIVVPLLARSELKGALSIHRVGEARHFSEEEFALSTRFGELAALAIDNAEIRARLELEVLTDHLTGLYNHRFFQERLAEEVSRATRQRTSVALLMYDIDDFKRVNDSYGHQSGDQVLQALATISAECCRTEDVLCRLGGEEFGLILPDSDVESAWVVAKRLREHIASAAVPAAGTVTVSIGVAAAPLHASSPRDLMASADLAMLDAKSRGKNRVWVFGADDGASKEAHPSDRGDLRTLAQLRLLQSLAAKLNRLNTVEEIGEVIVTELRSLIDYHDCRIYLLQPDGKTLLPVVFFNHIEAYGGATTEALTTTVGVGITGHVVETGESLYAPNASENEWGVPVPGLPEGIDESMVAVPLRYGNRTIGAIVLSKLGLDQFDQDDVRLLEVLASNAAVAVENARLLQLERQTSQLSGTLLQLSGALTRAGDTPSVLEASLAAAPRMLGCDRVMAWIQDYRTGAFRVAGQRGLTPALARRVEAMTVPPEVADQFIPSLDHPFVLDASVGQSVPPEIRLEIEPPVDLLAAPLRWEPDGLGMIVAMAPDGEFRFTSRHLGLARGIADITSLALGKARRFEDLEEAYLSTVEALANALEAQDEYTHSHARSLAEMAKAVGEEMGITGERLKRLEMAALFHDIGKIGVPSEIIRKPGPLTSEERLTMERHPEIGEQILEPVPFLQPIRPIIRACHERWDGDGYPDGLLGELIPLEARIVFVCDAYHAMTTDRPYRASLRIGEAIRRLKLSAGTQFDPRVVEVFLRLHARGKIDFHGHGGAAHPAHAATS